MCSLLSSKMKLNDQWIHWWIHEVTNRVSAVLLRGNSTNAYIYYQYLLP
jgi:hypothetical protein